MKRLIYPALLSWLLLTPSVRAAVAWVTPQERAGFAPEHDGTGLRAAYWKHSVHNNQEADSVAARTRPQATFRATRLFYPLSGHTSLARFLGPDAASLRGHTRRADNFFCLFHFRGYLKITPDMDTDPKTRDIDVVFALRSDDGVRLKIGGEYVLSRNGPHVYNTSTVTVHFQKPGLYPLDLIYYDDYGVAAGLAVFSSITGGEGATDAPHGTAGLLPTSVLYPAR